MDLLTAFYHTCHDYPGGCESLAPRMGTTPAVLRNKCNLNTESNKPLLVDADRAMGITGDYRVLHSLADAHGHICLHIDTPQAVNDLAILQLVLRAQACHGDAASEIQRALADGRIDRREMQKIREVIYAQTQTLQCLLMALETEAIG